MSSNLPPSYEEIDTLKDKEIKTVLGAIRRAELAKAKSLDTNDLAKRPPRKKDEKKNAFLYQVEGPTELPTLKFGADQSVLTLDTLDKARPEKRASIENDTVCRKSIPNDVTEKVTASISLNDFAKHCDDAKAKSKKVSKVNSPKVKKVRILKQPHKKKESIKNADDKSGKDEPKTETDKKSSIDIQNEIPEVVSPISISEPTSSQAAEPIKPKYKRRQNNNMKDQVVVSAEPPIPKPRKHSLPQSTDGFQMVAIDGQISQSQTNNNDDTWDLVAQHRKNTRAQEIGQQMTKFDLSQPPADTLQMQQRHIDVLTKPKTIREMRREQIDSSLTVVDNRNPMSAGIDRNGDLKLNGKNVNEESDTEA